MLITHDWEFLEDGLTIAPISVGLVAEDGREYYAVNDGASWGRINKHAWLHDNVLPHLPQNSDVKSLWVLDRDDPSVKPIRQIADEVRDFIQWGLDLEQDEEADLWAYYPAYDHVTLCQLWGPMMKKPAGVPMRTSCLKQEEVSRRRDVARKLIGEKDAQAMVDYTFSGRPVQDPATEHHALFDARHDMSLARWLGVLGR